MIPAEPRDGGVAEDRDGDLWRSTPEGQWLSRDGDCQRLATWPELVNEYGPLDVYVWRIKVRADDTGA